MNPSIIKFPITMKQKLTHTLQNGGHVDVGGTNQGNENRNKETRENKKYINGPFCLVLEILGSSTTQRVFVTTRACTTILQEQTTARRSSGVSTQTLRVVLKLT